MWLDKAQLIRDAQTTFHHFSETDFRRLGISLIGRVCQQGLRSSDYADILQTDVNSLDHFTTEVLRA